MKSKYVSGAKFENWRRKSVSQYNLESGVVEARKKSESMRKSASMSMSKKE